MLAEVARQILDHLIKLEELFDSRLAKIQTSVAKLSLAGIVWIFPFPRVDERRQTCKRLVVEVEHLPDLARGRAPAISDDVRGHRRAEFSVALVNVLNRLLALISARQIEIDVRPFASFFRKKTLKQQIHADRIDGSDSE